MTLKGIAYKSLNFWTKEREKKHQAPLKTNLSIREKNKWLETGKHRVLVFIMKTNWKKI